MSDVLKMLKLGLTLAIFASVACLCLALVNIATAPRIAAAQAAKANAGMTVVFENATSFEQTEIPSIDVGSVMINSFYLAKDGDNIIGVVVNATGPTYDEATMLVGIDLNRTITGIEFLALSDTPGFGQAAAEPTFKDQFTNLTVGDFVSPGVDFDGISGSTITTDGVTNILNVAIRVGTEYLAGLHGGA